MAGLMNPALERLLRSFEVRMKLEDLVNRLPDVKMLGSGTKEITGLCYDSRRASPGDLFIAVQGTFCDGSRYITEAVEKGAVAVLTDKPIEPRPPVPVAIVKDARAAKAHVA